MEKQMTVKEMEKQFESEWILVENPVTDKNLVVKAGRLLHHSKDRDEVYRKAVSLRPKRSAVIYTGKMPDNTAVVL